MKTAEEKCPEGLNIFLFVYFLLKCFEYNMWFSAISGCVYVEFSQKYNVLIWYKKDGKKNHVWSVPYVSPWNSRNLIQVGKQL